MTNPAGTLQIDTTAPAAPIIVSDTVNSSNITLAGTTAANNTVTLYDGQTVLGTTVANGSGAWSYNGTPANVTDTFYATATDAAGNTSALSAGFIPSTGQPAAPPPQGALTVGSTLEITQTNNDANVAFQSGTGGQLVLDQPGAFSGTISGFGAQDHY